MRQSNVSLRSLCLSNLFSDVFGDVISKQGDAGREGAAAIISASDEMEQMQSHFYKANLVNCMPQVNQRKWRVRKNW